MELIDFTGCHIDRHSDYSGSDRKNAIFYNDDRYMIKFAEKQARKNDYASSYVNNVFSEYVGSHIVSSLGIPAHETLLGFYEDHLVVACRNFVQPGETLHEFSWYLRNQYDSSEVRRVPELKQIYDTIERDEDLSSIRQQAISRYWDTFVADAFIGNFDRHAGNWGYIIGLNDDIRLAPVYDCGSSLYAGLSVSAMQKVMDTAYGIARRLFEFPKAALTVNGKKIGYYDMLASGYDEYASQAVLRVFPRIDMGKIRTILEDTPILMRERIDFYFAILQARYEYILKRAYLRVSRGDFDREALIRIGTDAFRTEEEILSEFQKAKAYIYPCSDR